MCIRDRFQGRHEKIGSELRVTIRFQALLGSSFVLACLDLYSFVLHGLVPALRPRTLNLGYDERIAEITLKNQVDNG